MNRQDYRKAFDAISFSEDFAPRTQALLLKAKQQAAEKERQGMKWKTVIRSAGLAAAVAVVLVLSVSAAVRWLSPAQVAEHVEEPLLAAAFESENAVPIHETRETGGYAITLEGMVSGQDLANVPAEYNGDIISDRTYAVFTVRRSDGEPLTEQPMELSYTPLVSGCHMGVVNAWTLGANCQSFVEDGAAYYLFDTRNLEIFADHTVYFAIYEGGGPSPEEFTMEADGSLRFAEDFQGAHALFTLPLDAGKADSAAAEAFVRSTGLEFISGEETVETETGDILSEN